MASSCTVHEMEDLNTSDHFPISVEFSWKLEKTNQPRDFQWEMIDWRMAKREEALENFQAEIQENLCLLLGNRRDSEMQLNTEIRYVAQLLVDIARRTLPQLQPRKKTRIRDDTLS